MKRLLQFTTEPITATSLPPSTELAGVSGAVVTFLGVVRGEEAGEPIRALEYEAFQRMATHQFAKIFQTIKQRWPAVGAVQIMHRIGEVKVNEPSLWVQVVAPHRGEAFAACQYLIEEMKQTVPIWKKAVR